MANITVKLIGGHLDGRIMEITAGDEARGYLLTRIPVRPKEASAGASPNYEAVKFHDVCYRRRTVCDVEVWAAEYLRPPQIVELLMERYARK